MCVVPGMLLLRAGKQQISIDSQSNVSVFSVLLLLKVVQDL